MLDVLVAVGVPYVATPALRQHGGNELGVLIRVARVGACTAGNQMVQCRLKFVRPLERSIAGAGN